ncbi:Flp family type IVb pilin [Coralliovum pocilloporae]|uniref:Flp family type IVb pilin n=1 Tax=Coralliovum pocilloporae TaxID=3066369 RepID=UPI0033074867
MLRKFLKDDRGATAVEYGLILAMISILGLAALDDTPIDDIFGRLGNLISASGASGQ